MRKVNQEIPLILEKISLTRPLPSPTQYKEKINIKTPFEINKKSLTPKKHNSKISSILRDLRSPPKLNLSSLEKATIKRAKKKKKEIIKKKIKKPSKYVKVANKVFINLPVTLSHKEMFRPLKRDLIKAKLQFILTSYIATILFTTSLSVIVGIFVFLFFLFFNFGVEFPLVTRATEEIGTRLLKVFWILFAIPISTFFIMYFYPSMEKKSLANKINQELPFVTIHMFAISGSMIDPSKIFSIIIDTKEYPNIEREFTRLINEINIYGYDLVSALRSTAFNNPSKKLAELFNGLATTITSGGDLRDFFDKRAQSLLFEHRLEREKYTKSAETFMDIYISVVIAAPMILMLLLIMIKISGLGFSLSTSAITLIMVLGVSMINILFLTFLHLKQPSG